MKVVQLDLADAQSRLEYSINRLRDENPHLSAASTLTRRQTRGLRIGLVAVVLLFWLFPNGVAITFLAVTTLVYSGVIINRVVLFIRSLRDESVEHVSDDEALSFPVDELPVFTVLVPAYREPEVIRLLLSAIGNLDYPSDRLDVKVLLEGDDEQTIEAATQVDLGAHVEIVLVPPAEPRTKPKALNYGLTLARGDIVSVFDAEDQPDRLQLRRAAVAFSRLPPDVACLQARLGYYNGAQNLITRWFTIEYAMWFSLLLPGLVVSGGPVPLGGTSNHFRRHSLEHLGAWDPYNVTEDADLGIRLARRGSTVHLLDSTTLEEANSDFVNWMKQRSRWYKGYLQTWLIHMRHPFELLRDLGPRRFLQFSLFVGGTPILAILNPLFWVLTIIWFIGHPHFIVAAFPAPVFYLGLLCWAVGNFTIAYLTVITTRVVNQPRLIAAAMLVPVYWVMMSVGAIKALIQLVFAPSYWEKTTHGLDIGQGPSSPEPDRSKSKRARRKESPSLRHADPQPAA